MSTAKATRQYELDWLRISAILLVFLYHSTRFFNLGDWHLKNVDTYVWLEIWNIFATRWMMPLFFILSGASLFYAIGKSAAWRQFYVAKFSRLMIPLFIGAITHSALQVYLEKSSHGQFSGSFFSFLPEYFNGVYLGIGMPGNFAFHGMHLWYLLFLFLYSLVCYRLFVWLQGRGRRILDRITSLLTTPGLIYLGFPAPLLIMKALIPGAVMAVGSGGWGFLYYIWFLIAGFVIVSSSRLRQHLMNQRWVSLLLGVVFSFAHLFQLFSQSRLVFPPGISDWTDTLLSFLSAWCWLFAILGFGMRHLAVDRPWLRFANEAVMPFYILHQTVLLAVGYFVLQWEIHDAVKWLIVFVGSFIAIIAFYTIFIRKFDFMRFLFGMKTTHSFFNVFRKTKALTISHILYIGLIVLAAMNSGGASPAMSIRYDSATDILLNAESITGKSSAGVRVVNDKEASNGRAIEFFSGANQRPESQPKVFVEMRFAAPAGQYLVWVRGKTDVNNGYTDSVWVQVDDQIGTRNQCARMGNWLDVHP
ncbi:MAG: acyltransferase, partial [Deltaproteobacteria bacterium]|nr:acyltransferase [Deltaproteobacteria bacterium]